MSGEEEHLARGKLVEREWQTKRRDYEKLQRLIKERCREAQAQWRSNQLWLAPGWRVTVPVRRMDIDDHAPRAAEVLSEFGQRQ